MCRLMVYLGDPIVVADLVTRPSHSVMKQSFAARERLTGGPGYIPLSINADGCGIGWYAREVERKDGDVTPGIYTSISPAWNDVNLERITPKIVSPLIFAHVRAAMVGTPVVQMKCHPFSIGRYMWMHNGEIGGFSALRLPLLNALRPEVAQKCPCFESDTAVAFAVFLNQLDDPMVQLAPTALAPLMAATIATIRHVAVQNGRGDETSMLNFVVSDGRTVVAARYTNATDEPASLHYATGSAFRRKKEASADFRLEYHDKRSRLGLVASEPLTDEVADWAQVPPNHMVVLMHSEGSFVDTLVLPIDCESPEVQDHVTRCFRALDQSIADNAPQALQQAPGGIPRALKRPSFATGEDVPVATAPETIFEETGQSVLSVAADGTRVFSGSPAGTIHVFDLQTGKLLHTLDDHSHAVFSLAVADGRLFSSSMRVVNEWDLTSPDGAARARPRLLSTRHHSDGDVLALAAAKGVVIGGPRDVSIHVEKACADGVTQNSEATVGEQKGELVRARALLTDALTGGHVSTVYAVVVRGRWLFSAAGDAAVKIWDLDAGKHKASLYGHAGAVMALADVQKQPSSGPDADAQKERSNGSDAATSPSDGQEERSDAPDGGFWLLSGGRDNSVRVWDTDTRECVRVLKGHADDVLALCGGFGGRFYSASADGTIRAWSTATWSCTQIFHHEDTVPLAIWPTERGVGSGAADGKVRSWLVDRK
ncbi:hypothetical protein KFL_001220160 [Klebsormidium nitens]|uniref:Glutamine amidotransferase type-2 domain-containing protein n=1 Tax=Klebsormidium nitens TaxID=105231 RepID=A0A1Y1I3S6_KLENI|nr:hypothetical protein KFL_001220160 [Klebsormidium nitens]|eukprot:GAQ82748.1 hypothetical protein KFL_001220160 [Klebsormidium nitens]